ncbi:hypothetical protein PM082_001063 [Marasmius tenuissimus]|nr:hypothetical protein PM082_001063 [Marasmius tenuissimus]
MTRPNIVVVGGSYVGAKVVDFLAPIVHESHDIILIEKNSHFQHLFAFPRIGVVPSFEHKAFIPFGPAFFKAVDKYASSDASSRSPSSAIRIHNGTVKSVEPTRVILEKGDPIPYEFLVMATGMGRPETMDKETGIHIARSSQQGISRAKKVLVVGGGAFGVQVATDIKTYVPTKDKHITLVHSRDRLLNRFGPALHDVVMKRCKELEIDVILGNRIVIPPTGFLENEGEFEVKLTSGGSVKADLVILTTGSVVPLSSPLQTLSPESIDPVTKYIKVKPTLQIDCLAPYDNVFAIGDVADTGAHKAARPGGVQAEIVARNIGMLIRAKKQTGGEANGNGSVDGRQLAEDGVAGSRDALEVYTPDVPSIHMSLGLDKGVIFQNSGPCGEGGPIIRHEDTPQDIATLMSYSRWWTMRAEGIDDYYS